MEPHANKTPGSALTLERVAREHCDVEFEYGRSVHLFGGGRGGIFGGGTFEYGAVRYAKRGLAGDSLDGRGNSIEFKLPPPVNKYLNIA